MLKSIIARRSCRATFLMLMLGHLALDIPPVAQDLPAVLPKTPQAQPPQQQTDKGLAAPTADNPEATAAEAAGPIAIAAEVSDQALQERLGRLLAKYPGVRKVQVTVEDGVVTLAGHVADKLVRDRMREFVRRVEGVNLVLNRTKTDAQV